MPRRVAVASKADPALSVASGVGLALCWPKPGLCFLGWLGLAPLVYAVSRRSSRDAFWLGWASGTVFHAVMLNWIYTTCRFAEVPVFVSLLAWAALAAFEGLAWGAGAWLGRFAAEPLPPRWRALGWAVAWTAVAAACERWTPRLPGDLLEYTQWKYLPMLQIASLTGPHGLGFVIVWFNAALAQSYSDRKNGLRSLALATAFAAAALVYGLTAFTNRAAAASRVPRDVARVEILQPVVDQYHKWNAAYERDIIAGFYQLLSLPRAKPPQLVVWPESALPYWMPVGSTPPDVAAWAVRLSAAQIVGLVTGDGRRHFNSEVLISPQGRTIGYYHKRELVPFGEHVPFAALLRPLIGKLNELGGITPGPAVQPLLQTPLGPAAATICYEAVFPRLARRDASRGARLIVNVTNDGWYKDTWGPYQHFKTNVYRAIENRVTVIRSGNTGISAVIDPWGVETARLDLNVRGRLDADVPLDDPFPARSLYARRGDWLGVGCMLLAAALAAAATRRGRASRPA